MSLVLLRSQTDERLVALAQQGYERAFEAIVRRYRRPLLSACRRIVSDALAEDVLQQAFVSAWTGLRRGDDVRDLRAWLFGIVRNTAVSTLRRAGHDPPALLDALAAAPSSQEEAERREVVHETLATIARLPERQREALLRIAVHGESQDDVADGLGVSRVAARALVHRARTTLRAAASALMPLPALTWLVSMGSDAEPIGLQITKAVAGAGGASATTTLLKAGAVAGMAAAVSTPMLVERHAPKQRPAATQARTVEAEAATPAPTSAATPAPASTVVPVRYTPPPVVMSARPQTSRDHARRDDRGSQRGELHERAHDEHGNGERRVDTRDDDAGGNHERNTSANRNRRRNADAGTGDDVSAGEADTGTTAGENAGEHTGDGAVPSWDADRRDDRGRVSSGGDGVDDGLHDAGGGESDGAESDR